MRPQASDSQGVQDGFLAPGADAAQTVAGLRIALAELLGHPAQLEVGVSVVDEIRAGPGGKFRAVTCRVPR